jgi:alpha-mannosidase
VYKPVSELENVAVDEKQMCTGLSIDKPNVVLSTFKPAEDGNGAIIRVYETMGIETDFTVVLGGCDCKINRSSADELKTMDVVRGAIRIAPFEIVTLRLTPVR